MSFFRLLFAILYQRLVIIRLIRKMKTLNICLMLRLWKVCNQHSYTLQVFVMINIVCEICYFKLVVSPRQVIYNLC